MRGPSLLVPVALLGIAATARPARADDATVAEALFRAGRDAMTAGDYEVACAKFDESHRLQPAPGTLLNLGECSEKLGRLASAWRAYREAADRLAGDPRQTFARDKVTELEPQLPRVRFSIAPATEDCIIELAGTKLSAAAARDPLPIDPGSHDVGLACEGRARTLTQVTAEPGQTVDAELVPGRIVEVATEDRVLPEVQSTGIAPLAVAGWITGAFGLASLGVGAALGGLAIDRKATIDEVCTGDDPPRCPPAGVDAASEGKAFATGSTVLVAAGAGLVALGAALLIVDVVSSSGGETARLRFGPGPWMAFDGTF